MKYNVPVHVRSSFSEEEGTMVVNEDNGMERVVVSAVTMNKNDARITLRKVPDMPESPPRSSLRSPMPASPST